MLTVRLDRETEKRLDFLAKETGRSKAYYVKELFDRFLEDIEDVYLAERTVERIRKGEERVYDLNEAKDALNVQD